MESRFRCEAIIGGRVDSLCLACEEHLKCERDADAHVAKPVHRKNLLALPYMDKYCDDYIRKFKMGYFCEFCNLLLPTAAKVSLHVADTLHMYNKATKLLKRVGNSDVTLENVTISERAWHGLIEDTCVICNVEYDNEDVHKNQTTHIFHLIQSKIQYGSNNRIYRLIDDESFQCLTCNMVLSLKTITEHFNNSGHHELYSKCLVPTLSNKTEKLKDHEEKQKDHSDLIFINDTKIYDDQHEQKQINLKNQDSFKLIPDPEIIVNKYDDKPRHIEISNDENRMNILDSVSKIQRCEINVDFETQSVFCKKCLTALDFNYSLIEEHIEEHVHKPKKTVDSALFYPAVNQNHNKIRLTLSVDPTSEYKTTKVDESNTFKHCKRALTDVDMVKSEDRKDTAGGQHEDYDSSATLSNSHKETEDSSVGEDINSFAKKNQLSYNERCRTAYCLICEANLPATLAAMKEHVAGFAHTIRTKKTTKSKTNPRSRETNHFYKQSKITHEFIEECITVKNDLRQVEKFIINKRYVIDTASFMLIIKHNSRLRCQVCDIYLTEYDLDDHVKSYSHRYELNNVPVITSLKDEFAREVRPGLFHCGFCHLFIAGWDEFRNHMKCSEHKTYKTLAKIHLDKYLKEISEERMDMLRHIWLFRMMFGNSFF